MTKKSHFKIRHFWIVAAILPLLSGLGCSTGAKPQGEQPRAQLSKGDPTIANNEVWRQIQKRSGSEPTNPEGFVEPKILELPITIDGRAPSFAANGRRLLFVSNSLNTLPRDQVFEFDLVSKKFQRRVFDGGTNANPHYLPDGRGFLYMSTTDEEKEHAAPKDLLTPPDQRKSPFASVISSSEPHVPPSYEIYVRLPKNQLYRLTKSPGYDGDMAVLGGAKSEMVYVSYDSEGPGVYRGHVNPAIQRSRVLSGDKKYLIKPQFQPRPQHQSSSVGPLWNRNLAWIEGDHFRSLSLVMMARGPQARSPKTNLTPYPGLIQGFTWHPSGDWLVFSASFSEGEPLALYSVSAEGKCLSRLSYGKTHDFDPDFSPDGSSLVFASDRSGQDRLYIMEFLIPRTCTPATP
jgi:hypothetical protein